MFKLESYLTPLILNYVNKYIKNLKPEDSQFSLWGGDAVFCNLDLRLDVLEQELQLPFTFVNGHIHELRIHVPWTKLGSEPVVITINTIECILKLHGDESGSDCDSQKIIHSKKSYSSRSNKRLEVTETPPGYIQSLINRVISNICIICNNLILKYVEDDVVLSLNIKSVELINVNEKWERAFVDTNMSENIVRKVITMHDLTVCLDKRDASGKIEAYQDPLLYRCSTTWRLYSVYNSPHSKYPMLTRVHMFCENLEFSLTDQQLPMFLRLLYLCVALQNRGTFKEKESSDSNNENSDVKVNIPEETEESAVQSVDESWGSWAWSFIPEVPYWSSTDYEEQEEEAKQLVAKKILQFGIFIGKSSCTLKQTLNVDNVFCGAAKCNFVPLMILHFYGCSVEFTCKGKDFLNIQAGISGATVTGLEDCACGHRDNLQSEENFQKLIFVKSGVPPSSGHAYSYLSSSLFDPLAAENCGQQRKYNFDHEEHFTSLTEEVMVQRFPAFAFDYFYQLKIPDEWMDRLSSVTTLFLEESNWHESSVCRLVFGPLCIDVTSSFFHRISKLMSSMKDYDYPCYTQPKKAPAQCDDIESDVIEQLEEFVPSRQYHLTFFKPVVRLFVADHTNSTKQEVKKGKKKRAKPPKISLEKELEFYFEIYVDCIDLQATVPMYPARLVAIVDKHPSPVLLHHCYSCSSIKLFGLEVSLQKEKENYSRSELSVIEHTSVTFFTKSLVLPEKWVNHVDLSQKEYSLECTNVSLKLCEVRTLAAIFVYYSWIIKYLNTVSLQKLKSAVLNTQVGPEELFIEIFKIKCSFHQAEMISSASASVASMVIKFKKEEKISLLFHAPESTQNVHGGQCFKEEISYVDTKGKNIDFMQLILQVPEAAALESHSSKTLRILAPLFVVQISGSTFCIEPAFLQWLSLTSLPNFNFSTFSEDEIFHSSPTEFEDESTCSSRTQDASVSQTLTKSVSTTLAVNSESEFHKILEGILFKHSQFLSNMILEIDIGSVCGLFPYSPWSVSFIEDSSALSSWRNAALSGSLNQAFMLSLPVVKIKNNNSNCFIDKSWQYNFPVRSFSEVKTGFPLNLQIESFSAFTIMKVGKEIHIDYLIKPSVISATIALSLKSNQKQLALCIHMDSKFLGINLSAYQTAIFVDCLKSLLVFYSFAEKIKFWLSYFHMKPDALESNTTNLDSHVTDNISPNNDYTVCEKTDADDSVPDSNSMKLTLWSQLTLSKLSITVFGRLKPESNHENFKIIFDAEEIISSVDIQDVYSKVKVKLTSLSSNCFTKRSKTHEWNPGPFDGIILICNDEIPKTIKSTSAQHSHAKSDNQPFLVATYTKALCSNAKEKWTSKQNTEEMLGSLEYISEIDLKVKSFDFIVWISLFDLTNQIICPFINLYKSVDSVPVSVISEPSYPFGISFCSQNLPLLYIESNIIQIYLPENTLLAESLSAKKDKCNSQENSCDILILQVEYAAVTSQVENPLTRIILDTEIYNAALKSKALSLPGAAVEDRQYQIDVNGFALGSLSGKNMLWNKTPKRELTLCHPLTMGENPALEWNIGVIPDNRNIPKDSAVISPIVSPLNIRIAVAPAIVCDKKCNNMQTKIIVAGISVEISVTSDISLYLSINQICFIYSLVKTNLELLLNILYQEQRNLNMDNLNENFEDDVLMSQDLEEFPFIIPSCFTHMSKKHCLQSSKVEKNDQHDFVPFEVLVTAGTVTVMFYYHEDSYTVSYDISSNGCEEDSDEVKYTDPLKNLLIVKEWFGETFKIENKENDARKNFNSANYLHPFLYLCIIQPHSYVMCQPHTQKFESSCFDLQLHGSPSHYTVKKHHESFMPVKDDFLVSYLETKPGEPNSKTGIPPSFFTVSCTDFFNSPASIKIYVERPVKFNLRTEIFHSTLLFLCCFLTKLKQLKLESEKEAESFKRPNVSPVSSKINMKFFKDVNLCSTQTVIEFIPDLEDSSKKLILTAGSFSMEVRIETFKDEIKSLGLNVDVAGFTLHVRNSSETWSFLQPVTFSFNLRCHLNPWFQIELRFIGESMLVNLSFHHLLKLKEIVSIIQEQLKNQLEGFKELFFSDEKSEVQHSTDFRFLEAKKRHSFIDDLRKGSFQFIQACETHDAQPKAQEIVFNRATSNQPASMTWRYPEPRALTKIEISPVPFQCEEGKSMKDQQVLTCYLQYWNSSMQEYQNLCDFMLSETEHCSLDLPDLNSDSVAVSDKWRVLLDCKSYIDDDGIFEIESPCLSPLALAACMSIDSCFDPSIIPIFQVQASFELLKVSLFNYFDKEGCSPSLYPFEFDDESPQNQEFSLVSFINPCLSCMKWSSRMKLSCSSGVTIEVLEFRNLTMLPIISPVDIIFNGSVNHEKEKGPVYDLDLVLHPCFFRISQSVIHSLTFFAYSIKKDLLDSGSENLCTEYALPNYYIICNNIQECIRFGQIDTEEYIILSPMKMHAYSWWCHKKTQMLRVSFGSCQWKWSQEFSMDEVGEQTVMVDNTYVISVKVKQLSNLQRQVVIGGQLIAHSELSFPIQLKCDFPLYSGSKFVNSKSFMKSLAPLSNTPTFVLAKDQCKTFKISFTGILDSQLWSEEISFGDNKILKIPWMNSYQNVWCQVTHQGQNDSMFVAVMICPLFILRSNLPIPLSVDVVSGNADGTYSVDLSGKGQEIKLFEGSDHKVELVFHSSTDLQVSMSAVSVSVSDLSNVNLLPFDKNLSLEEICYERKLLHSKMWPYSFLERICHLLNAQDIRYPCFEICNNFTAATSINETNFDVKVEKSQCWSGLNTLLIDIKPNVMLINRLRLELYLFDKEGLQWIMPQNSVALPSDVHKGFWLSIKLEDEHFYSPFLTVEDSVGASNGAQCSSAFSVSLSSSQSIPQNGSVTITVRTKENRVCLFKLISQIQEGIIVITAYPAISVLNKTGENFHLVSIYSPLNASRVTFPGDYVDPVILSDLEICQPLLFWNALCFDNLHESKCLDVIFYICISYESEDKLCSYPLCLHPTMSENTRHTLSVPVKHQSKLSSIPLCISSHKWEELLLLVVDYDQCPMLLLHNQTNMNLFYGQSISDSAGKFVYEELQKHEIVPFVQPGSSTHYTFPLIQENFPLLVDKIPMLCLGLMTEDSKLIWSAPFKITLDKQFVHILGICDFMIHCRQVGHTVYLYIDPVNRIELTAKEVRSRIALAANLSTSLVQSNSETMKLKSRSVKKSFDNKSKSLYSAFKFKPSEPSSTLVKVPFILYLNVRVVHTSFILCDEFKEKNKCFEVVRLNIDNAILFSRPKSDNLKNGLQEVFLCLEHVQLDNQMDKENNIVYDFPVIFQRYIDSSAQNYEKQKDDLFLPNKVKENSVFLLNTVIELPFFECDNVTIISLKINLLPVSLCIEDTFYYRAINLLKTYTPRQFHRHSLPWCDIYFPQDVLNISSSFIYPVHFQELSINIPKITLSLHASLKLYLSLENSVLKFQPFEKENIITSSYEIGHAFILHYLTGALFRAGWVVGSLDLLGNPAGFARAVKAGMSDFVYLPYKGFLRGPRAFISGLSSGARSLFMQISSGTIICMASLAASISRNMDFLSLDDDHLARQEILRHHLPQGISEGLMQGLSGLGLSLLSAVAGIADHPLQAFMSPTSPIKTASGVIGGLGKGLVGVFTKPIGGAAELLSQTGYGILHGAGWLTPPKRQYQPVTMALNVLSSSCLKYACKIAQCASLGDVLLSIEATYVNENGEYEKNILLLTSEALCVLAEDEITLQRTFALTEIGCKQAESDQSTLVLIPNSMYKKQIFLESSDSIDRVVEYIIKNREENLSNSQDEFSDFLSKSTSTCHVFYLFPNDRNLFMTLFSFAKNKAMGKGFFTEC